MRAALDDYRWLVSQAAQPWLGISHCEPVPEATVGLVSRLRKDLSVERAHLVIEQFELRRRAREKFSRAGEMFLTRKGLEQATDEQIAAYKASRFGAGESAIDLCCGIGGDLIALAHRGPSRGVDRDPVTALFAAANLAVHGVDCGQCTVEAGDAMQFTIGRSAWHCDPDRRSDGRRATRGELFEPPLSELSRLLACSHTAAIKLAPATDAPIDWKAECELEWLGSRGECRQQVAWFGALARHAGKRSATIVGHEGEARTLVGDIREMPDAIPGVRRFLYEPHPAVLAARLTAVVCYEHSLVPISAGIAYLTGDNIVHDAAIDGFEVRDILPLDRKQLTAYCRQHHLGRLEIKKRGVAIDPHDLRKEIIARGDEEAVILVAPVGAHVRVIVARRISST